MISIIRQTEDLNKVTEAIKSAQQENTEVRCIFCQKEIKTFTMVTCIGDFYRIKNVFYRHFNSEDTCSGSYTLPGMMQIIDMDECNPG